MNLNQISFHVVYITAMCHKLEEDSLMIILVSLNERGGSLRLRKGGLNLLHQVASKY